MEFMPIGCIYTEYNSKQAAPRQGRFASEPAKIEIFPQYQAGLKNIELVSHLIILYGGHQADRDILQTKTPFSPDLQGVFACRSPNRPNPIAVCVAKLIERQGNSLIVTGVDAVNESPLLDIKPYSSAIDSVNDAVIGWHNDALAKERGGVSG